MDVMHFEIFMCNNCVKLIGLLCLRNQEELSLCSVCWGLKLYLLYCLELGKYIRYICGLRCNFNLVVYVSLDYLGGKRRILNGNAILK